MNHLKEKCLKPHRSIKGTALPIGYYRTDYNDWMAYISKEYIKTVFINQVIEQVGNPEPVICPNCNQVINPDRGDVHCAMCIKDLYN